MEDGFELNHRLGMELANAGFRDMKNHSNFFHRKFFKIIQGENQSLAIGHASSRIEGLMLKSAVGRVRRAGRQVLTRDHVVATSRGGRDSWDNVVAACKRCNHHKGSRLLQECGMELMALPYLPNFAEYLALTNSGRILGDQMDFLRKSFGSNSRLLQ